MKPDNFEDISAVLALYRPGPMGVNSHTNYALRKNGLQEIEPIHPELAEPLSDVLDTTYGLIVYQEQVMAAAQKLAGFTLGQADILRRAMGKKKKSELDKQQADFFGGMTANGYSPQAQEALWKVLESFADYAFNKAHTAAYGLIAYWTAYLKAHYPAEYMAALLTSVGDAKDKLAVYLNECRRMGIKVLPPDVAQSIKYFAAVGDDIRFGLGAVRNVGSNVVEGIVGSRGRRRASRRSTTSSPRCRRTSPTSAPSSRSSRPGRSTRSAPRAARSWRSTRTPPSRRCSTSAARPTARSASTSTACGTSRRRPRRCPTDPSGRRRTSSRSSGRCSGSTSPITRWRGSRSRSRSTRRRRSTTCSTSDDLQDGDQVTIAGLITSVQHRVAKSSGNPYGMITVEDFNGEITVMFMGKTYTEFQPLLQSDAILVVRGRVSRRDDGMNLHAQSAFSPDLGSMDASGPLTLVIAEHRATEPAMLELPPCCTATRARPRSSVKLHGAAPRRSSSCPTR